MNLLQLLTRLRRDYLDDLGGDLPVAGEWITDDSECRWSNSQLVDFLNTSVAVFLNTVGLYDSDPVTGALSIPLVADQSVYAIPDHVIYIERVRLGSAPDDGATLRKLAHLEIDDDRRASAAGPISYYQDDLYHRQIRLWGTPTDNDLPDTLECAVKRLAVTEFAWDADTAESVFPETVHPRDTHRLLPYAAYLAYSVEDAEADVEWPQKARHWLSVHRIEVGEPPSAELTHWCKQTANKINRAKPFGLL